MKQVSEPKKEDDQHHWLLTPREWRILKFIAENLIAPSHLTVAKEFGVTRQAITMTYQHLEEKGFLQRVDQKLVLTTKTIGLLGLEKEPTSIKRVETKGKQEKAAGVSPRRLIS